MSANEQISRIHGLLARLADEQGEAGLTQVRELLEKLLAPGEVEAPAQPIWPSRFGMIGDSPAMKNVWAILEKVIESELTILVTGESGTGKELVATALKEYGPRKKGPFVCTNCAAIPETLLEGELFGHVRGSFTGAVKDRAGRFEEAHKGTMFLDEIGEMSHPMQSKLLRVLQDGEIRRVGSNKVKRVDVRLVTATNRDLEAAVKAGTFREDLFFRINVFPVHLPPLREREGDALLLAKYFLVEYTRGGPREGLVLSPEAEGEIASRPWPGNIRELQNAIRRGVALAQGSQVRPADF